MHRYILRHCFITGLHRHHSTDARAMQVTADDHWGFHHCKAAHADVLTDLGDQGTTHIVHCAAAQRQRHGRLQVARPVCEHHGCHAVGKRFELVLSRHEIGFAVHFDDGSTLGVR
jgi:hypothetical protein